MEAFKLPTALHADSDGAPSINLVKVDPREVALDSVSYYADLLFSDIVLVPFVNDEPDWSNTTRETIEKFAGDWTELRPVDVPRLGILTDSFARFIGSGDDVVVITLWREGTPDVRQIDGSSCPLAVRIIEDTLIDEEPLTLYTEDNPKQPETPKAANDNQSLAFICPAGWQDMTIPLREWWLQDLIPMRQVTILNGDGGVGKSLLALQLAAAGSLQCQTLGTRPLPGRAMYIGAEDDADEFHRRLADIVQGYRRRLSDLGDFALLPLADRDALLSVPEKDGTMKPTALWTSIAAAARSFRPKLIALDTSADLFGGDEIKRGQVRQFIAMLRKLAIEIDCAVLLLSHPSVQGMQSGTGSSGSTAWNNSVRSRLYLTKSADDEDMRILTTKKANYGKVGGEIKLRWQEGAFVLDDGKPSVALGLVNRQAEKVFRRMLSLFNRTGQTVSDVTGTNYAPAKMAKHPDAEGIGRKALAEAMQRLLDNGEIRIAMDGPPSRQRKRLILASEDFGPKDMAA